MRATPKPTQFKRLPIPGDPGAGAASTPSVNVWLDETSTHLRFTARRDASAISKGIIRIRFPYDPAIVRSVKDMVPGRSWNPGLKEWNAASTPDAIKAVVEFANANGLSIDPALASMSLEYEDLPPRRIIRDPEGHFEIHFPWGQELGSAVRTLPGREWNGAFWTVPAEASVMQALVDFGKRYDFEMEPGLEDEAREAVTSMTAAVADSKAESGTIEIENFGQGGDALYPFQKGGVEYVLSRCNSGGVLIADEMGLGKTPQSLAAIAAKNAYPAVIVCPASLKENWRRETQRWLPGRSVVTLKGRKPMMDLSLFNAHVYVLNYDVLHWWIDTLTAEAPRALVLDESHMTKNARAKRSKACRSLAKSKTLDLVLLLTGTPIMNRPAELISQLQIMGRLEEFGGWKKFTGRYCQAYQGRFGYNTDGAANLEELNFKLRSVCMVRRLKADVLKELPPKVRTRIVLPLTNRAEYDRTEADVIRWIGEQASLNTEKRAEFRKAAIEEWDEDRCSSVKESASGRLKIDASRAETRSNLEQSGVGRKGYVAARARGLLASYRNDKEQRAAQAEQLIRIEALKQVAVAGKMKAALGWIGDFLETGEQLIVFATHINVVEAVADAFPASRKIYGGTPMEARAQAVDDFQSGKARIIVGNIQAMGVGLTLTAASNVAFLELPWTPAALTQAEDRAHRIGQDSDSVTAHYLLSERTIDEEIEKLIAQKRKVVEAATDGTGAEASKTSVLSDLVATLRKRGGD